MLLSHVIGIMSCLSISLLYKEDLEQRDNFAILVWFFFIPLEMGSPIFIFYYIDYINLDDKICAIVP